MPTVPFVFFRQAPTEQILKKVKSQLKVSEIQSLELPDQAEIAARVLYSNMRDKAQTSEALYCYIDASKDKDPQWTGIIDRLNKASRFKVTEADQS